MLPEILELDFIINDESVNRYGYRIMTEGINTENFEKNPVCCIQHRDRELSVGKWKNLRKENRQLKGTLEFDRDDEEAVRLYQKYKNGYMNAVSLSVLPVSESDKPEDLLPGQKYSTVILSDLLEISLVTVPGQGNAVRLFYPDGKEYKLNLISKNVSMEKNELTVEQLREQLAAEKQRNAENLVALHFERGVLDESEKPSLIKLAASDYDTVKAMLESRKKPETSTAKTNAETLVHLHISRGAINAKDLDFYVNAAMNDYEGTKRMLEAHPGKEHVQSFLNSMQNNAGNQGNEREKWNYLDWYKKDMEGLNLMAKNEPDKYNRLVADFTDESKKMGISTADE